MKRTHLMAIIFLSVINLASGQIIDFKKKCVNPNDSVLIQLNNYKGDVQWQQSSDSLNWVRIDQTNVDALMVLAEKNMWYRAEVRVGNCEPFISDVLKIVVKPIEYASVTDVDGNVYKTVQLGEHEWMAENLRVSRYADSTSIPLITDDSEWGELGNNDKGYCWFYNDSANYAQPFGALYTWSAATYGESDTSNPSGVQGACPTGWHIPSNAEWTELEEYLIANGYNFDGSISDNKVGKSLATRTGWGSYGTNNGDVGNNQKSNNLSGFSAFPSGGREDFHGRFSAPIFSCGWFTSTESSNSDLLVHIRSLFFEDQDLKTGFQTKSSGLSVRCVKDK